MGPVEKLGRRARAATPAEAAAAGDLVEVSVPPRAQSAVPAAPLPGKPVLDVTNYAHSAKLAKGGPPPEALPSVDQ